MRSHWEANPFPPKVYQVRINYFHKPMKVGVSGSHILLDIITTMQFLCYSVFKSVVLNLIPVTELVFLSAYSLCSGPRNSGIVAKQVSSKRPSGPTCSSRTSRLSCTVRRS